MPAASMVRPALATGAPVVAVNPETIWWGAVEVDRFASYPSVSIVTSGVDELGVGVGFPQLTGQTYTLTVRWARRLYSRWNYGLASRRHMHAVDGVASRVWDLPAIAGPGNDAYTSWATGSAALTGLAGVTGRTLWPYTWDQLRATFWGVNDGPYTQLLILVAVDLVTT